MHERECSGTEGWGRSSAILHGESMHRGSQALNIKAKYCKRRKEIGRDLPVICMKAVIIFFDALEVAVAEDLVLRC